MDERTNDEPDKRIEDVEPSPASMSPREERAQAAREGNVDYWLENAASYQLESAALVAIVLLLRDVRDELRLRREQELQPALTTE